MILASEGTRPSTRGTPKESLHQHPLAAAADDMETLALDADDGIPASRSAMDSPSIPALPTVDAASHPFIVPAQDPSIVSPSYSDFVSSPFHGRVLESGGNVEISNDAAPVSPVRSESSSSVYFNISVSDPQEEVESYNSIVPGGSAYFTYLITTSTNAADYGGESSFSVRRRFRDVVTLADRLGENYRGFFIPVRPDKSVVESQVMQKQDFVEQRRVELEKYMRRLARHPVIRRSDELKVFLTVQGKLPLPASVDVASRVLDGAARLQKQLLGESNAGVEPQDVVLPGKGGMDVLRFFKELKQSVVNDWGNSKPLVEEEDKEFLEKKEKLWDLEQQLTDVSKQAESLVNAQQDMGETVGELGLAFIKLTKFENEQALFYTQKVRAADMKIVATAAVKVSRLYRELNAQSVKQFDILHEYMGMMLAMHNAFSERSSALLTVQTLISELSSLHLKAEKLEAASPRIFGVDKSRTSKLQELKDVIRVTDGAKECATREYERIKESNRMEITRLDGERKADFVNMLKGFIMDQVAYNEKIGNEWAKVEEEIRKFARDANLGKTTNHDTFFGDACSAEMRSSSLIGFYKLSSIM